MKRLVAHQHKGCLLHFNSRLPWTVRQLSAHSPSVRRFALQRGCAAFASRANVTVAAAATAEPETQVEAEEHQYQAEVSPIHITNTHAISF